MVALAPTEHFRALPVRRRSWTVADLPYRMTRLRSGHLLVACAAVTTMSVTSVGRDTSDACEALVSVVRPGAAREDMKRCEAGGITRSC